MDLAAEIATATHSQRIAHKIGAAQMGVEVYGWAIKNAMKIPAADLKELLDIVTKEPA